MINKHLLIESILIIVIIISLVFLISINNTYRNKILELTNRNIDLKKQLDTLSTKISEYQSLLQKYNKSVSIIRKRLSELEDSYITLLNRYENATSSYNKLYKKYLNLKILYDTLLENYTVLVERYSLLEKSMDAGGLIELIITFKYLDPSLPPAIYHEINITYHDNLLLKLEHILATNNTELHIFLPLYLNTTLLDKLKISDHYEVPLASGGNGISMTLYVEGYDTYTVNINDTTIFIDLTDWLSK